MSSPCKAEDALAESCELSLDHDVCLHCGRSAKDITNWQEMTHDEKRAANISAKARLRGLWHK